MTSKAETCYIALLAKLQTVTGIGILNGAPNVSRRLTDPTHIPWDTCPAIMINQNGEEIITTKGFEGVAAKQKLSCDLVLVMNMQNQEDAVSPILNEMVQNIRTALYPTQPDVSQTLNGIVSHCWISGKIVIIEGVLNNQGMAIIPVEMLTNI